MHVRASQRQRQADWFEGMEGAFLRFGGVPAEVLIDNAKALVEHHDAVTREVRFNARLHAFARYWGFTPQACAPYRARTKGKDERGVGYVKKNAIAGRRFESWAAFEAHLDRWTREVADQREHGTTGVAPAERFADEARALRPLAGRAPFGQLRDLVRKVQADCAIDLDTNSYSVPWRLIGESVQVVVLAGRVIIRHAGQVVADHALCRGRRQGSVANFITRRSYPSIGHSYAAALKCSSISVIASVMTHGPTPKARSIMRFSPTGSRVRLKTRPWPFRRARITSKPLIVA